MIIVKVVLPFPIRQCFKYFMPDKLDPIIGGRIVVPFRSKDIIGIVISFYKQDDVSQLNLRYVKSLIDTKSLYTDVVLDIIIWVIKNYQCSFGDLFFSVLPKLLRKQYVIKDKNIAQWSITKKGQTLNLQNFIHRKKQFDALLILKKKIF